MCFICLIVVIKILMLEEINKEYNPIPGIKLKKIRKIVLKITPVKLSYIIKLELFVACRKAARGASI